jgi:hypothetical protein
MTRCVHRPDLQRHPTGLARLAGSGDVSGVLDPITPVGVSDESRGEGAGVLGQHAGAPAQETVPRTPRRCSTLPPRVLPYDPSQRLFADVLVRVTSRDWTVGDEHVRPLPVRSPHRDCFPPGTRISGSGSAPS